MPGSKLYDRGRPKRSTAIPERQTRPYLFNRSKLQPRQRRPNEPELSLDGDESSSDESGLDGESDSEGEDNSSDEEEEAEDANPFANGHVSATRTQTSISATTTTNDNPFATAAAVTGSPSNIGTSTITSSPTTLNLVQPSGTEAASSASSSVPAVSAGGQPQHTTAIALGAVLGVLSVAIGAYLLFRYCTPLKARVAAFRGRRGSKLSGEEDGVLPQQPGRGMAQSRELAQPNAIRYSKAASLVATPAPSYTRNIAIAVPITSTRVPAPISIHPASRDDDPNNPFSDNARTMSRNNSQKSIRSQQRSVQTSGASHYENSRPTTDMLGEPGTYAFKFSFDDYRMSGTDIRATGLSNDMPSGASGPPSKDTSDQRPIAPYPPGIGPGLGLGVDMSPQRPKPARFSIPYASASEVATPRTQYTPRQRQSITPSESVSNAPYSPVPMPAMPAMNSRWSKNSSSVWARGVDDKGADLPEIPATVVSRPPPLPLTVRASTSSMSSLSSSGSGSRRSSSRDSGIAAGQGSSEKRSTFQPAAAQRLKTVSTVIGLPTSVRPASNIGSGVTLKPVAYRP